MQDSSLYLAFSVTTNAFLDTFDVPIKAWAEENGRTSNIQGENFWDFMVTCY